MKILLETPVFTTEAALNAAAHGADRLELCSSFAEGGETPGAGMLAFLKKRVEIPVFVMIRPRGGDFVYTQDEIGVMEKEIELLGQTGADGFVFGCLKPDGAVDKRACKRLVNVAGDKPCTFHRAFDVCSDPETALETVIACGFTRILTSGGANSVAKGLPQILRLMELAEDRIIIMPGGGMKPELVAPLEETGRLREIHASCKITRPSENTFQKTGVEMQAGTISPDTVLTISPEVISRFRRVLEKPD